MKYIAPALTLFAILFVMSSVPAQAETTGQYGQYGQYGGGAPSYSIMVDKMVSTGQKSKGGQAVYVDNLSPSDPRFAPGTQVQFQIKVKNTSNVTITNVAVQDVLPEYVDAVEGPGDYNPQTRIISWTYPELKSGEEKIERVIVQIKTQADLPADKGLMCMNNKVVTTAGNASDEDTSQFCVEKTVTLTTKGGQPVKTTPEAGAPLLVFGALNLAALAGGIFLKKRN
ncbi:DUF11 domain-containing protein [Candidatus Woesebacteria bacterium]|nr:DUF11 domain-containing protein [Candidatus Woesebacteria bacterium]